MKNNFFKTMNFGGVMLIVICASLSYAIASYVITHNTIAFSTPPETVSVRAFDEATQKHVTRNLPVHSQFPIDTVAKNFAPGTVQLSSEGKADILLYHQNPMFLVWIFLVCAMLSIAAGSAPVFIKQSMELKRKFSLPPRQIWWAIAYAVVLFLFLLFSNTKLPGYYDPPAMFEDLHILFKNPNMPEWIVGSTIALILPALVVIFLIGVCSDSILTHAKELNNEKEQKDEADKQLIMKDIEEGAKKLKLLHKVLTGVLQVLAVIVVFSVLTSSALRQAIHATVEIEGFDLYPTEVSMVYGMYFSLFLCIIYLPVYYYIKQNYLRLREIATDINPAEEIKEKSWYKDLLGDSKFEGTALENIRLAMTMLAPLLTGLIPETLQIIK